MRQKAAAVSEKFELNCVNEPQIGILIAMPVLLVVEGVCSLASCIGQELAPHVKKHGSKLLPDSLKKDKDGKSTFNGAMVVAASGVQGNVKTILQCKLYSAYYESFI